LFHLYPERSKAIKNERASLRIQERGFISVKEDMTSIRVTHWEISMGN